MLQSINIKKFALFSNTEVNFNDGMTALSGETGAGKSIIIDAIGLLMGRKNIRKIKFYWITSLQWFQSTYT